MTCSHYHRKGSVIILVVGLLVMLAMVGTTFIFVTNMDRRESVSIATAAPMKQVAVGVRGRICLALGRDLRIDDMGTPAPADDEIFGLAANYAEQVDFPHELYDKHLSVFIPVNVGGTFVWRHLSNLHGATDLSTVVDVPINHPALVDCDGFVNHSGFAGDAMLWDSGLTDRRGRKYYVGVRTIDTGALMHVNSAYATAGATAGTVMPVTNNGLLALTDSTACTNVHNARAGSTGHNIATFNANWVRRPLNPAASGYLPYDAADAEALAWGGMIPNAATGRLFQSLGVQFFNAQPYLTVFSASRDYVRKANIIIPNDLKLTHRADLNNAGFVELFKAFYAAIPPDAPGMLPGDLGRRVVSAQLAANVIDFRDNDDTPYQPAAADMTTVGLTGVTIYGVERQPFITEAWLRMEWDAGNSAVKQWSAIELFNPYKSNLSLAGTHLKIGANAPVDLTGTLPATLAAGQRLVILSSSAEIRAVAALEYQAGFLDLREVCTLLRPTSQAGNYAPIGRIDGIDDFGLTEPMAGDDPRKARIRRDDDETRAKYSVAWYDTPENYTYLVGELGCPIETETNLGRANTGVAAGVTVAPTPVFVRNSAIINLGDVLRLFYVGPGADGTPLDETLAAGSKDKPTNGRLNVLGNIKAGGWGQANVPNTPPACMLSDYMAALVPDPANTGAPDTIYGRNNINTMPQRVIECLPGISGLPPAQRQLVASELVAYRDLLDNTAAGGRNYSAGRAAAVNITDLRDKAGFAGAGEIAIPLAKSATPMPRNTYGAAAPDCYHIADGGVSDDGLGPITGDLSKYDIYYSWLANQVTVRSDVYIAYIAVFGSRIGGCGTVTSAGAGGLTDSKKKWRTNQWRNVPVVITSGPGKDQVRTIISNTDTTLTVANWTTQPAAGVSYQILSVKRRYITVIDRSNCRSVADTPRVVMFAEMK